MFGIRLLCYSFCFFPSLLFLCGQNCLSCLKRLARLSHPCETLPVCLWLKMLVQIPRRSELDLRVPFCHWGRSNGIHQELRSPPVQRVPLPECSWENSSIACSQLGLTRGLFSLLPLTLAKSRCLQENTEIERSRHVQGCPQERFLSCLPPSHSDISIPPA